ncbi:MAG: three-Cys-motif partner protein TcmP [Sedimentibacter sp.]
MSSSKKNDVISKASPHTIKKFEVIEEYIKSWAQKLMLNENCNGLIFIDCMCNSGVYIDGEGNIIYGTPVRVANALLDVAHTYPYKQIHQYFNDICEKKISKLQKHLPENERNYRAVTSVGDANELLKTIGPQLNQNSHMHYFLLYDPYDASIDWEALIPFFRNWGEVMINHMVSDPVRAINSAKNKTAKEKYENTYLADFEKLVPYGSDKNAYEKRVESIIKTLKGTRNYYVAAFPFYNSQNSQMYNLIHCTSSKKGFILYKKSAWKVFGAQSSTKHTHNNENQLAFDANGMITTETDESCFKVSDIAKYLQKEFSGEKNVPLRELWEKLEEHPIFPSDGYRNDIKDILIKTYGANKIQILNIESGKKEYVFSFR